MNMMTQQLIPRNYILQILLQESSSIWTVIPSVEFGDGIGGFLIILIAIFIGILVSRVTTVWYVTGGAGF